MDSWLYKKVNEQVQKQLLSGQSQKFCAETWLHFIELSSSNEMRKENLLQILNLEIIDKLGDSGKICLDMLTKLWENLEKC